jgi:hypothetical protein
MSVKCDETIDEEGMTLPLDPQARLISVLW